MDNLGKFDRGFYLACTASMPGDLEICFKSLPCWTCKFKWVLLFDAADIAQAVCSFCHARQELNRSLKSVSQGDLMQITTGMTSQSCKHGSWSRQKCLESGWNRTRVIKISMNTVSRMKVLYKKYILKWSTEINSPNDFFCCSWKRDHCLPKINIHHLNC